MHDYKSVCCARFAKACLPTIDTKTLNIEPSLGGRNQEQFGGATATACLPTIDSRWPGNERCSPVLLGEGAAGGGAGVERNSKGVRIDGYFIALCPNMYVSQDVATTKISTNLIHKLTLLGLQSRFRDKPLKSQVVCPPKRDWSTKK